MGPTGKLCTKHGGNYNPFDGFWICDACAREGIDKCPCGSHARYFGEAMMCAVKCEGCGASLMQIGFKPSVRDRWNQGMRGYIEPDSDLMSSD